ncbi:MAG TPA: SDR family oxidoreductase [bacterium]|nr:SDR family oxidoreductase [bacterium]
MQYKHRKDFFDLKGKLAVVTGAGGLLGGYFCNALAAWGANIVLCDIRTEAGDAVAVTLREQWGIDAVVLKCDVTSRPDWIELREEVLKRFQRVDILVNGAGFTNATRIEGFSEGFESFPDAAWCGIMDVNLTGVFIGCQVLGSVMAENGSGSIINIASQYGVVSPNHGIYDGTGINQPVAYSVSKAGVIALTRYLATYWGRCGVRVNALTPGGVYDKHTDPFLSRFNALNPMGRMAAPDELSGALVFLASDSASYVTGQNLIVDGGWTVW